MLSVDEHVEAGESSGIGIGMSVRRGVVER